MNRLGKQPPRHRFILNPYAQERFTYCPQCDGPTEEGKFPLLIHVDPMNPFCLNKTCRYCPRCDLLIANQDEVEEQLAMLLQEHHPELIGNGYLVIGTLDDLSTQSRPHAALIRHRQGLGPRDANQGETTPAGAAAARSTRAAT